jgi:non-specific serine/threonine protein kinase
MSQEALAEQAGLSRDAIGLLERGARRSPRRDTIALLARALKLAADEHKRLIEAAAHSRSRVPLVNARTSGKPSSLPVRLTSFIGREREIAEVKELLQAKRLVTLTGTGGIGKTSLALEVVSAVKSQFGDGVAPVELATLADPELVAQAVATALGVREIGGEPIHATLLAALRPCRLLLVLDNCEHLLVACAALADAMLRACPDVKILATSREALGIGGEIVWRVPSLSVVPTNGPSRPDMVLTYEAARLFVERAKAVEPSFALTTENALAVAQICWRLDGIPLAVELAARRVVSLSVQQISARLDQRFRLLTNGSRAALPRQQTLAAAVGWSYDLLTDAERTLFSRLSVFAGGFTFEAAEAVCRDEAMTEGNHIPSEDVLDLLTSLIDKSLVEAEGSAGNVVRYRLLETLRQYGRERLVARGDADVMRRRHAQYFRNLAVEAEPHLLRTEQLVYLARLDREIDNLRTALQLAFDEGDAETGLDILVALQMYQRYRGMGLEQLRWLQMFLALPVAAAANAQRARALAIAALLNGRIGQLASACALFDEALATARASGDRRAMAEAGFWQVIFLCQIAETAAARSLAEECLRLYRTIDDLWGISWSLSTLAHLAFWAGDSARARDLGERSLVTARQLGDRRTIARALEVLGDISSEKDEDEARAHLLESLALYREVGNQLGIVTDEHLLGRLDLLHGHYLSAGEHYCASLRVTRGWRWMERIVQSLGGLAAVAAGLGQPTRALRLGGASSQLSQSGAGRSATQERAEVERALAQAWTALGDRAADVWCEGEAMTLEHAIAYALEQDEN